MSAQFWERFKSSDFRDFAVIRESHISAVDTKRPDESTGGNLQLWMLLLFLGLLFLASFSKVFFHKEIKEDIEDGLIPSLVGIHTSIDQSSLVDGPIRTR
jgi:hypothetical protein